MLRLLRTRNFAALWSASLLSGLGNWMMIIALPFYVFQHTGSTIATGALFIAETLPSLVAGSVVGVFVDLWDRQRTMIAADVIRMLLILVLLFVPTTGWLWLVYLVAFLESGLGLFFDPASSALLPRLVGEDHLLIANAAMLVSTNIVRLSGSVLGGLLLSLLGVQAVVALDSASYLCSAMLIGLIRLPLMPTEEEQTGASPLATEVVSAGTSIWSAWRAGLRVVWQEQEIRALFVVMGGAMVADGFWLVLLVPYVRVLLQGDALTLGWVQAALGLGGLLGGLLTSSVCTIISPRRLLALSLAGIGVLTLALVNARALPIDFLLCGLFGVLVTGWLVSQGTLLQTIVPDQYRGRVFATYGTTISVMLLFSMGLASLLATPLGTASTLDVAGVLYLSVGALGLVVLPAASPQAHRSGDVATVYESNRPLEL